MAAPAGKSAIRWLLRLLLRSSSDSEPTCTIPTSSHRTPRPATSRRTAVSAIDTTSSSSSHAAHSRIRSPSVYLPATPCAASSTAACAQCRGVYTSSAWMPASVSMATTASSFTDRFRGTDTAPIVARVMSMIV